MTAPITDAERELLARSSWTFDELITLAFVLRRLVSCADLQRDTVARKENATNVVTGERKVTTLRVSKLDADELRRLRVLRRASRESAKVAGYFRKGGR